MEEIKKYYQDIVPFDIAVALNEAGYHQNWGGNNDVFGYAMHDDFTIYGYRSTKNQILKKGALFCASKLHAYNGKYVVAPKLSEVLDWLMDKGIVIELTPGYTYALKSNLGFEYTVHMVVEGEGLRNYPGKDFASFPLCMHDAIEHAIKIYQNKN